MMKMVLVLFLFASTLTLSVSESYDVSLQPHTLDSFDLGYIQMKGAQNCSYLVTITTSCSSPKFNGDEISIAFGDTDGNQVYAEKLDDPVSRTFEQCESDSFQIDGPCASPICSLYLYRKGSSDDYGWKPESVKIYGYNSDPVTFTFNTSIPKDEWYGYNFCDAPPPPPFPFPPPPSPPPPPPSSPPPPPPSPPPPPPPSPPPPPPPPPSPPPSPPPPSPSPPPPPPCPPSSSIQLYVQKWVLFVMVLGSVFSIWM